MNQKIRVRIKFIGRLPKREQCLLTEYGFGHFLITLQNGDVFEIFQLTTNPIY